MASARVPPVTVRVVSQDDPSAGHQTTQTTRVIKVFHEIFTGGLNVHEHWRLREIASNRSRSASRPARPATAIRWIIALVEPPKAISMMVALSKDAWVRISDGFKSSQTISTIRRPDAAALGHDGNRLREWMKIREVPCQVSLRRHHGCRCTHDHAGSGRPRQTADHILERLLIYEPGTFIGVVAKYICATAKRLTRVVTAQHGARRHVYGGRFMVSAAMSAGVVCRSRPSAPHHQWGGIGSVPLPPSQGSYGRAW